jgi:hypothetical protein
LIKQPFSFLNGQIAVIKANFGISRMKRTKLQMVTKNVGGSIFFRSIGYSFNTFLRTGNEKSAIFTTLIYANGVSPACTVFVSLSYSRGYSGFLCAFYFVCLGEGGHCASFIFMAFTS